MFRSYNAFYLSAVALVVFALGVVGLSIGDCALPSWQDRILDTVELFLHIGTTTACSPSWPLIIARYAAPYIVPFVALFATIKLAFANLRHDVRIARARYKRGHVVVCGLGDTGMQIVESLHNAGQEVIAVDLNADSPHAAAADRRHIPVLKGDASDRTVLHFASVRHARAVIVCTGEDAENVDIALRIQEIVGRRQRPGALTVLIEMRYEWLFAKLIDHDKEPLGSAEVEVRPFNTYQNAARVLVQQIAPQLALDGEARPIVIVGFGSMGREVCLHLIRAAPVPLGQPTRIVVFDRTAEELGRGFVAALPPLDGVAELTFVTAEVVAETTEKSSALEAQLPKQEPLAVVVCLPDDKLGLFAALGLRAFFDRLGQIEVPIFVRLRRHHRLGEFAAHIERMPRLDGRLRVFGSLEALLKPEILLDARLDTLAKARHQHYLDALPADRRTALNARAWHELPEHFKMSSRREADHIAVKLAQVGCAITPAAAPVRSELTEAEIDLLARLEHRRWTIERQLRGWTYGPVRDDARHLNPYLVAWDDLPEPLRADNRRSIAALPQMLLEAGIEIRRRTADGAAAQPGSTSGR